MNDLQRLNGVLPPLVHAIALRDERASRCRVVDADRGADGCAVRVRVDVVLGEEEYDFVDAPEHELIRQKVELRLSVERRGMPLRVRLLARFRWRDRGWGE